MYTRYWILNLADKATTAFHGRYGDACTEASHRTLTKGGTHLVLRCVAHTQVITRENKRRKR